MPRPHRDPGFTLLELLVVVLVLGVLLAIAVPTFLGARVRAQDRVAQRALSDAVRIARPLVDERGWMGVTPAVMAAELPQVTFMVTTPSSGPRSITLWYDAGWREWWAAARSASGRCFTVGFGEGYLLYGRHDGSPCSNAWGGQPGLVWSSSGW